MFTLVKMFTYLNFYFWTNVLHQIKIIQSFNFIEFPNNILNALNVVLLPSTQQNTHYPVLHNICKLPCHSISAEFSFSSNDQCLSSKTLSEYWLVPALLCRLCTLLPLFCPSPKCRMTKCRMTKCQMTKCWVTKCRMTKCQMTKCWVTKCQTAKCWTAKCRHSNSRKEKLT
jgi:hypothetical protein